MRFVIFCHSLESDWNHGNAHFLRGITTELLARGHTVDVWEPQDGWSRQNLIAEHGPEAILAMRRAYPQLHANVYAPSELDPERAVHEADVVLVHEWNEPSLVAALGAIRRRRPFRLLFHDTHHRAVSAPHELARFDLAAYDAALVFGRVLERLYTTRGTCRRAFTWHEAADTRVFHPMESSGPRPLDLVWVGNWGDDERTRELETFLWQPIERLGLRAEIHGVRYPEEARARLARAGAAYKGWLPNFEVPRAFSRAALTVHVPRRHYAELLEGIPTIRPFEALACGVPLVCAPWKDVEGLFEPGRDYLVARDGAEMQRHLAALLADPAAAAALGARGRATVLARHTCAHRVDELFAILGQLGPLSG